MQRISYLYEFFLNLQPTLFSAFNTQLYIRASLKTRYLLFYLCRLHLDVVSSLFKATKWVLQLQQRTLTIFPFLIYVYLFSTYKIDYLVLQKTCQIDHSLNFILDIHFNQDSGR